MSDVARLSSALADRYRIERELGAGGMATVYLAEDLKHRRHVALKVLKPELAAVLGADRFVQEITTTASLSHPHILPLFDSGEAGGFLFYVMPFVEGETLRDKLDRETQLGVDEAVRITTEVADALQYAHEHGVIHRDIKPENILLQNGRPMVADFGIALAVSAAAGGRMTETGLSLGTPHYMSPEQATAEKEITARSDVYSLASVCYEMLAGQPPHLGGSAQQIIMKIIAEPVAVVTQFRRTVPPNVAAALAKALEKLPADRFVSATAFAAALGDPHYEGLQSGAHGRMSGAGSRGRRLLVPLLAATTVVTTAVAAWSLLRPAPPAPLVRYSMRLGENVEVSNANTVLGGRLALSPDGMTLAFVGMQSDEPLVAGPALYLRSRGSLVSTRIAAVSGRRPFWKPDGRAIGVLDAQGRLIVVGPTGDAPHRPSSERFYENGGASWGSDGFIYVVSAGGLDGIHRIQEDGGASERITVIDTVRGEGTHLYPTVLPGSRGLLFTIRFASELDRIAVVDLRTGQRHDLVTGSGAWYSPSGHLLFLTDDGTLMARPFDLGTLTVTGEQMAVLDGVGVARLGPELTLSSDGTLMYLSGSAGVRVQPSWVTEQGAVTAVDATWTFLTSALYSTAVLSPDGSRAAVSQGIAANQQLWVRRLPNGPNTAVTSPSRVNGRAHWTVDGRALVFVSDRGTRNQVWRQAADGSAPPELLVEAQSNEGFITPDSAWLVHRGASPDRHIFARRLRGDTSQRIRVWNDRGEDLAPMLSPDGRWLAYVSTEAGRSDVYLRPFPDVDRAVIPVSIAGGVEPLWSRDGRTLYYRSGADSLMRVPLERRGATIVPGEPRQILSMAEFLPPNPYQTTYDVTADGRRFFMLRRIRTGGVGEEEQLIVVENLADHLKGMARK